MIGTVVGVATSGESGGEHGLPSLSVVLPAWNEAAGIEDTLHAVLRCGDHLVESEELEWFELVVVDDASSDGTGALIATLAADDDRIRLLRHDVNTGLGGALISGFGAAKGSLVLYTDSDLPFDLSEVATALRVMREQRAHVVAAYRNSRRGEGPRRWCYSAIYNLLVRWALGLRVRDVNFAGKLLHRDVLDRVQLESTGSFIDAELLAKVDRSGFTIAQFGVDYRPRSHGVSTLSSMRVISTILSEMWRIAPTIRRGRRPGSAR